MAFDTANFRQLSDKMKAATDRIDAQADSLGNYEKWLDHIVLGGVDETVNVKGIDKPTMAKIAAGLMAANDTYIDIQTGLNHTAEAGFFWVVEEQDSDGYYTELAMYQVYAGEPVKKLVMPSFWLLQKIKEQFEEELLQLVTGDSDTTVRIDGEDVPSVAKRVKDALVLNTSRYGTQVLVPGTTTIDLTALDGDKEMTYHDGMVVILKPSNTEGLPIEGAAAVVPHSQIGGEQGGTTITLNNVTWTDNVLAEVWFWDGAGSNPADIEVNGTKLIDWLNSLAKKDDLIADVSSVHKQAIAGMVESSVLSADVRFSIRGNRDYGWGQQPQGMCYSPDGNNFYVKQHSYNKDSDVISRFNAKGGFVQTAIDQMLVGDRLGHQTLVCIKDGNNDVILAPSATDGSIVRFDFSAGDSESDSQFSIIGTKLTGNLNVFQNEDGSLIGIRSVADQGNKVQVFEADDFLKNGANASTKYELSLSSDQLNPVQGLAIDGDYLYVLSSNSTIQQPLSISVYHLPTAELLYLNNHLELGWKSAAFSGNRSKTWGKFYETEAICVHKGQVNIIVNSEDAGREGIRVYQLGGVDLWDVQDVADGVLGNMDSVDDNTANIVRGTLASLAGSGLLAKLHSLYIGNVPNDDWARVNWIDPDSAGLVSKGSGMTRLSNEGWLSSGNSTDYFQIGDKRISEWPEVVEESAHFGILHKSTSSSSGYLLGADDNSGDHGLRFNPYTGDTHALSVAMFGFVPAFKPRAYNDLDGFFVSSRKGSRVEMYNGGVKRIDSYSDPSTPAEHHVTLGYSVSNTANDRRVQALTLGAALSEDEYKLLREIVMDAVSSFDNAYTDPEIDVYDGDYTSSVYSEIADGVVANMNDIDSSTESVVRDVIERLSDARILGKISDMYIMNVPNDGWAKVNWVDPNSKGLVASGKGMARLSNEGFESSGNSDDFFYVGDQNVSEIPALEQNSAHFSILHKSDSSDSSGYIIGGDDNSGDTGIRFSPYTGDTHSLSLAIFGFISARQASSADEYSGFLAASRTKDRIRIYNRGIKRIDAYSKQNSPSSNRVTLGYSTGITTSGRSIQAFTMGSGLTDEEVHDLREIVMHAVNQFDNAYSDDQMDVDYATVSEPSGDST